MLVVSFCVSFDYEQEQGHRYLDLAIYAPANYVGVYSRSRWNISEKTKEEYVEGCSEWKCLAYHDSCWTEGVEIFLKENESEIICLDTLTDWYEIVNMSEEEIRQFAH